MFLAYGFSATHLQLAGSTQTPPKSLKFELAATSADTESSWWLPEESPTILLSDGSPDRQSNYWAPNGLDRLVSVQLSVEMSCYPADVKRRCIE